MAENLRARVGRIIAGSVHALLDKIEDQAPEAMMEQAVREVDQVIDDVRAELGTTAANRHLAQQQHAELNRRHVDLGTQIEHAIAEGRDDLARAAVARQLDIEAQLPVLESRLADLGREEQELKGYVDALLGKKREMLDAVTAFRASRAKAAAASPTAAAGTGSAVHRLDDATAAFDKVYARHTGMTVAQQGATLAQSVKLKELDELVRNSKIEERLTQLKTQRSGG
jgi:phage shock protein A